MAQHQQQPHVASSRKDSENTRTGGVPSAPVPGQHPVKIHKPTDSLPSMDTQYGEYTFLRAPQPIYKARDSSSSVDAESIATGATTPTTSSRAGARLTGNSHISYTSVGSMTSVSLGSTSRQVSPKSSFGPDRNPNSDGDKPENSALDLVGEGMANNINPSPSAVPGSVAIPMEKFRGWRPRRKLPEPGGAGKKPISGRAGERSSGESKPDEPDDEQGIEVARQPQARMEQQAEAVHPDNGATVTPSIAASAELALKKARAEMQTMASEMQRHGKRKVTWQKFVVTTGLVCANFILIFATWWWPHYYPIYLCFVALPLVLNCSMIASVTVIKAYQLILRRHTSGRPVAVPPPTPEPFVMLMPCYNETLDECTRSLDSLVSQVGISRHPRAILVVCDGKVRGPGMEKTTAEYLQQDILTNTLEPMRVIRHAYTGWDGEPMDIEVTRGWFKGVSFYCLVKRMNQGKRDSLIVARSFLHKFNQRRQMPPPQTIFSKEMLADMTTWLERGAGLDRVDHLVGMDADTVFDAGCIQELLVQMRIADVEDSSARSRYLKRKHKKRRPSDVEENGGERNVGEKNAGDIDDDINDPHVPRTVGVCGYVAVDFGSSGSFSPWHLYQNAEYSIAQALRRLHQSVATRKVSCLPGCCQLLRVCEATCGDEVLVNLFGYHPRPMDGMLKRIRATASEDRNHVCLMLTTFPQARTRQALWARAYTDVPKSLSVFLSQRRRWTLGATSNDLLLFFARGTQWWERIVALSNVLVWSLNVFVIASIASMVVAFMTQPLWLIMCFVGVMLVPIVYYVAMALWLPRTHLERIQFIVGLAGFVVLGPFINISVMFYAVWNMDSFGWGKTRQVVEDEGEKERGKLEGSGSDESVKDVEQPQQPPLLQSGVCC